MNASLTTAVAATEKRPFVWSPGATSATPNPFESHLDAQKPADRHAPAPAADHHPTVPVADPEYITRLAADPASPLASLLQQLADLIPHNFTVAFAAQPDPSAPEARQVHVTTTPASLDVPVAPATGSAASMPSTAIVAREPASVPSIWHRHTDNAIPTDKVTTEKQAASDAIFDISPQVCATTSTPEGKTDEGPAEHATTPAQAPTLDTPLTEADGFRATVMPQNARVAVDLGAAGKLSVQMRVKNGVADVKASGQGASLITGRNAELRLDLNSRGIALGSLEIVPREESATRGSMNAGAGSPEGNANQGNDSDPEHKAAASASGATAEPTLVTGDRNSDVRVDVKA